MEKPIFLKYDLNHVSHEDFLPTFRGVKSGKKQFFSLRGYLQKDVNLLK